MGKIQTFEARHTDARFLAAIDAARYPQDVQAEYKKDRLQYWQQALVPESIEPKRIFVALEAGGYLGYLALHQEAEPDSYEICLGPMVRDEISVRHALIMRAGIALAEPQSSEIPEDVAVA